jgi:hypothetical protein
VVPPMALIQDGAHLQQCVYPDPKSHRYFNNISVRSFVLTGAPDFKDLANYARHHVLPRKQHGSTGREVIEQFVALASASGC